MDQKTLENRLQAAYETGVRDGRYEGYLEGVSATLHRLGQIGERLAAAERAEHPGNVIPLRRA